MPYPGQINFQHLEWANEGYHPDCRVFLQEIGVDGRAGSKLIEVKGFSNVTISRGLNTKGKATITFANVDDRLFQGGPSDQSNRVYSPVNKTLTRKALSDALRKSLPYVKEINPIRRASGTDRGFQGTAPIGNRINEYLDFVYNFTGRQGVLLNERATPLIGKGARFVDLLTLGLMQRVFIDIVGQDGLVYAGFSGIVSSITDEYQPGQVPTVTLMCSDYWRLFEIAEILVKQGPGTQDPAQGSPDIRDTIFFDIQSRLGLSNDDYRASPFDSRPGQLILLDIMRITQNALCFIPNLQLRAESSAILGALNLLSEALFDTTFTVTPNPSLIVNPDVRSVDVVQDANFVETRREFFVDDSFWTLPDEKDFNPSYEGHTSLRRVSPGVTLTRAINTDGTDKVDTRGQKADQLLYVDPKRKLGEGIKDGDYVGMVTGSLLVDKFILTGTQAIVYQQLVKSIMGPWQVQYATGLSILKKLSDATFYDLYFTGNGDLVYQIPRYSNLPGEYSVSFASTSRKLSLADKSNKAATADAVANPEDGGESKTPPTVTANNQNVDKTAAVKTQELKDAVNQGRLDIGTAQQAQQQIDQNNTVAQQAQPNDQAQGQKAAQQAAKSQIETNENVTEIVTDYQELKNPGLYDYSPDPRYPLKYHGYNYVITDLGLRRWNFTMTEEPLVTVMRVPGGSDLLEKLGTLEHGYLIGRTNLTQTRKLQQRFGVRPRTTQQIMIPDLFTNIANARILLDAFAAGLLQQVNGLGDGGSISLSSRPDLELGHNVLVAERQKLYYIQSIDWTWTYGKDSNTNLSVAYGHDIAEELPNPWAQVSLADLLAPDGTLPGAIPPQGTVDSGDAQNRIRVNPGTSATWQGFVFPVPTMSYRGDAKYSQAKVSDGFHQRTGNFHYGADIMFRRRDKEPKYANNGSPGHFMPNGTPVVAAGPGAVLSVQFSATFGWNCVIDHRIIKDIGHVYTFYQHMSYYNALPYVEFDPKNGQSAGTSNMKPLIKKAQEVKAGDILGYGGRGPSEWNGTAWVPSTNGLVHLHFELWIVPQGQTFDRSKHAVDPEPYLALWGRVVSDLDRDGSQYTTNKGVLPPNPSQSFE